MNAKILNDGKTLLDNRLSDYVLKELGVCSSENREYAANLLSWLSSTPRYTVYRVNTLFHSSHDVLKIIHSEISRQASLRGAIVPSVFIHSKLEDVVLLDSWGSNFLNLNCKLKAVIVDVPCGMAVLRGSNIYAPGIKGMPLDINPGDIVSIFVDVENKCTRGLTSVFSGAKYFVGNGIIKIGRNDLFGEKPILKGVAVEVTDSIRGVPCLPLKCVPETCALLQNLPSVLCGRVLNPHPGELVLDMCAAPGNKTTHLAMLMKNMGTLIALDKTNSKVQLIKNRCEQFGIRNVKCFVYDATKAVSQVNTNFAAETENEFSVDLVESKQSNTTSQTEEPILEPPFSSETFDRILLDAPCSALGQRPQFISKMTTSQLKSYPPLQRKLFKSAISLLKKGGSLVYSTCTVTVAENEHIVQWVLNKYPCLQLQLIDQDFGGPGLSNVGLTESQRLCVRRFGPPISSLEEYLKNYNCNQDTVGFFIAHFIKEI